MIELVINYKFLFYIERMMNMSVEGYVAYNESLKALKGRIVTIPQVDDTLTRRGYSADAEAVGNALDERVKKSEIVDNLTSNSVEKPLSAKQGGVLKKMIEDSNLSEAGTVGYDNATSGLTAVNMQGAIDEVADIAKNALPKTGGMVEGVVHFRNANNGYTTINKNNTATTDYGTKIVDKTKDEKSAYLTISAMTDEFSFTNSSGKSEAVHHGGNKPFGSYEGNGSATSRTIATKGIGRLILVYNTEHFSFVTPEGALVIKLTEGSIRWIDSGKVFFLNGNLGLSLTNEAFNKSGTTYYYQVI